MLGNSKFLCDEIMGSSRGLHKAGQDDTRFRNSSFGLGILDRILDGNSAMTEF